MMAVVANVMIINGLPQVQVMFAKIAMNLVKLAMGQK